jgi:mannose-6-phosphate isomerase-like protein (cupin superfamily)
MPYNPEFPPSIVPAGAGRVVHAFGEEVVFYLTGEQTNGQLCLWTEKVPPGGGPPPHVHLNEDEWFVVREGRFDFLVEGQWREVTPGGTVFVPRQAVHTFRNSGEETGLLLVSTSPAGFETFFTRCAEVFQRPEGPDMERIMQIAAEHGIHFVTE